MPQALKLVIPGIVNTFIGLFKDTSLVLIIGLFDLLGIVQQNMNDPKLDLTPNAGDGLCLRRVCLLHLLLRHVALFRLYGTASRHPVTNDNRGIQPCLMVTQQQLRALAPRK